MAGAGSPPKPERARRNKPARGDWTPTESTGWQHGKVPTLPTGYLPATRTAWKTWMGAWFAVHWTPADLPGLALVIGLYDQVQRGEFQRATELRLHMDNYGITPKGQQDRRWKAPEVEVTPVVSPEGQTPGAYTHLRAVES